MPTHSGDDVEWLDDDGDATPREDEVLAAGSRRPPLRRRTRIALGALAVAVLGTAVTVAVITGDDGREQAAPTTRTVAPTSSGEGTFSIDLPQRPPASALAAIRAAYPKAELTGFSAALAAGTRRDVFRFYNASAGRRMLTITVGPLNRDEPDAVLRTATTLELAQALGTQRVRIQLRLTKGAPTARDFAAIQRLVQDARLLATR